MIKKVSVKEVVDAFYGGDYKAYAEDVNLTQQLVTRLHQQDKEAADQESAYWNGGK